MRELRPGLWHWEAPHLDWSGPENEAIRQRLAATAETPSTAGVVSSYAIDTGDQVLLFDPLAAPSEDRRACGQPSAGDRADVPVARA